ncbi:DUF1634 domain-containing protein [Lactobacillus terrae]|uniref:DUF1634 domain-containing protein n=1 Tax=Lactobacillus terrae TaxID=2269374 RepID=UPI000C1B7BAD|nr:DUF1634 domain-containing protein [Lactobacillus terrae]
MDQQKRDIELIIGRILRIGVVISAIIITAGIIIYFISGSGYSGSGEFPRRFTEIFSGIASGKSYAVIMLGIFMLILTPVLRVVVSIYAFFKEGDKLYTIITTIVLIILIFAIFWGYRS